jgi:hypothetical protein
MKQVQLHLFPENHHLDRRVDENYINSAQITYSSFACLRIILEFLSIQYSVREDNPTVVLQAPYGDANSQNRMPCLVMFIPPPDPTAGAGGL